MSETNAIISGAGRYLRRAPEKSAASALRGPRRPGTFRRVLRLLALVVCVVGSASSSALTAQERSDRRTPDDAAAADEVLARLDDGTTVTRSDYLRHLFATFGSSRLEELVIDRVLERTVAKLDAASLPDATRRALADPDARTEAVLAARIRDEHGGDPRAYESFLARIGTTVAEARIATRLVVVRDDRMTAYVQATRAADAGALQRTFERHYGVDGLRVTVRHLFVAFGRVRHELDERRPGTRATDAEVDRIARERCTALKRRLDAGEAFSALVAAGSDDRRRKDGVIPDYDFTEYGVEFADVVRPMAAGEVVGPVRTTHGWHVVEVLDVVRTRREDVEGRLPALLRAAPPTLGELQRAREALLSASGYRRAEDK
jgi:hypothetical protein